MAAAAPPVGAPPVVAPPVVAPPAAGAPVKNELNTLKVGVFGSLKKGENWQPISSLPPNEPPFKKIGNIDIARSHPPGKQVYANLEYTNYDVAAVPADFKDASGNPIVSIEQVPAPKKQGRFYGKGANDPAKIQASFQTALKDLRKTQFTTKLAKKKADNKATLSVREKDITKGTQSELDEMTKVYTAKKTELQAKLEQTFKEHKKKVLDNKEQVADKKYDRAPRDLLANDLQTAGEDVIGSLPKPRETRRRHRFMHLLVKAGDAPVPAPAPPQTPLTPEAAALAAAQKRAAESEAQLARMSDERLAAAQKKASESEALLATIRAASPHPGSHENYGPDSPPPPSNGGNRKRKTKRKRGRRSTVVT